MINLLSNFAGLKRFLEYAGLIPLVLQLVWMVEGSGKEGPVKKQSVLAAVELFVAALVHRGFVPDALRESLRKNADELAEIAVGVFNSSGIFTHGNRR